MIFYQYLSVRDFILCTDKDERNQLGIVQCFVPLIVSGDLDPHDPRFIDYFLNDATVLANHFPWRTKKMMVVIRRLIQYNL